MATAPIDTTTIRHKHRQLRLQIHKCKHRKPLRLRPVRLRQRTTPAMHFRANGEVREVGVEGQEDEVDRVRMVAAVDMDRDEEVMRNMGLDGLELVDGRLRDD